MTSAASIRARLLNIAREQHIPFQQVLARYFHERFIYRISVSPFADKLILKGGNLVYAFQGLATRPTKDIDYLAIGITNREEKIKEVFSVICSINFTSDHVIFNPTTIVTELISEQQKYKGIRVYIQSRFHTTKQRIQIDIGFGDIIIPQPLFLVYPVLLNDLEKPRIKAYTVETIIAEKFHAMIELSILNSRMKDFYDVYHLLKSGNYKTETLQEAILSTFNNRKTRWIENHSLFTPEFGSNSHQHQMWIAFLKKTKETHVDFNEVLNLITQHLKPLWDNLRNNQS